MHGSATLADMDGGWKQIMEQYLEAFFLFFFPKVHALIDFGQEHPFLDQELAAVFPGTRSRSHRVDKLLAARRRDQAASRILLHVEVQARRDSNFARRMFDYNYRIGAPYGQPVSSMALLVDGNRGFRPDRYFEDTIDCSTEFKFRVVKLLDFKSEQELLADLNPLAFASLVQLTKLRVGQRMGHRFREKVALVRELCRRNYSRDDVQKLFCFMDHIITLPEALAGPFRNEVAKIEEEAIMPYLSTYELKAKEEGRQEGHQEGREEGMRQGIVDAVRQALEVRFGRVPQTLLESIQRCESADQLRAFHKQVLTVGSLDDLQF
ncbi:MAG: hypothetical protein FJ276_19700 [Planctomycetes bacterium]|nr:hypothetical protein [Planctomycetota bacterium]